MQPLGCWLQVCFRPAEVQRVALRVHWLVQLARGTHWPPEHTSLAWHERSTTHSVQPDAWVLHETTVPDDEHCFAPAVHWSVQLAMQLPAVQIKPLVQAVMVPN